MVGAGRVGRALALRLAEAGYRISEVIGRGSPKSVAKTRRLARRVKATASRMSGARLGADVVWFCVPDGQIASAAGELARFDWRGKFAFHASGARSSNELAILRERGAKVASLHPLMTFIPGVAPELAGATFAVEGDPQAVSVAADIVHGLGGNLLRLRQQNKAAYHAFATLACPLLLSLLAANEKAGALAGISRLRARRAMFPIIRQTLANYEKFGAEDAFTGPIARGDEEIIRKHLTSLETLPETQALYIALARAALQYLPKPGAEAIDETLRQFFFSNLAKPLRLLRSKALNRGTLGTVAKIAKKSEGAWRRV